jgi:acyl-CoA synthetase (NDP forming)
MGGRLPDTQGLTTYRSSAAAVRALGRAATYAAWLAERTSDIDADAENEADQAGPVVLASMLRHRSEAATILAEESGTDGWVDAQPAARLLKDYGLQPAGGVARGRAAVVGLAESIGFPVVIKFAGGDVVHRTERGLVRVGLDSPEMVGRAVASFEHELGRTDVPVLVQPVVSGVELALGVVRDPSMGPLVMVGAGGVNTDILADRAYLLPPVRPSDVRRALRGLRCWPLLDGFRGSDAVAVGALVDLVVACGRLSEEVPQVAELDVNPVMVSRSGCELVDVKLRLADDRTPTGHEPRQLRRST